MRDLDGEFADLQARLRARIEQPALHTVIQRARQRYTRRRMQLGAAVAVLVVAVAIPVLRTALRPAPYTPVPPQATLTLTAPTYVEANRYSIDFADARHGFAMHWTCTSQPSTCTATLLVTEDGGENWLARAIPAHVLRNSNDWVALYALGPYTVSVGPVGLPNQSQRFYTADAGLSWRPVQATGSDTSMEIPDGGILDLSCVSQYGPCDGVPVVVMPDSGRVLPLRTKLPLDNSLPAATFPLAGGWWIAGTDPATGKPALAVSRDAGRSWSVKPLPNAPGTIERTLMIEHGTTLYAAATRTQPGHPVFLAVMFRSVDGGNTWEQTFVAGEGEFIGVSGSPVAAEDGRLIVGSVPGPAWSSRDGGHTFQQLQAGEVPGYIQRTRGGYLANPAPGLSNVYKYSVDGVTWKEITVG